jgi:phage terminase large subunit-like protein
MTDETTKAWVLNRSDELAVEEGCYFSVAHGEQVCKFIEEFCRLSKGRWAGQTVKLFDWQRKFLMRLFGWRRADGKRRFRRAYLEVAKKNGKSSLISAIALYLLLADKEAAPEVYLNAVDKDQAGIVFEESSRMLQASPALKRRAEVTVSRKVITAGHGRIVTNSSDAMKQDGLNASAAIFDELHRQKDRALWDVMEYAGAAREQSLTLSITTAGEEEEGVWFEQREYSEKVEAGVIEDSSHLGLIFRALETDDLDNPETWRKANPSLGQTISEDDFEREWEEAKAVPAKLANFKRLRLNIVCRAQGKFLELASWDACDGAPDPRPADPTYMGLDLSTRDDLSALIIITGDFGRGFDVQCRFWLPRENIYALEMRHSQPYRTWADQGFIVLTPGNVIDYDFIESEIVKLSQTMRLVKLMSDPYNAQALAERLLNKQGLPVEYLRQGYLSLSDPTKTLLELITGGKLRHGGNPIRRWHASNAIAEQDAAGNIKLSKGKSKRKIDGMAGLVNAVEGAIKNSGKEEEPSVYETRGLIWMSTDGY